jgi:hypothetical protein
MNHGRHAGVLLRFLAMLIVVVVAGILCWAALNNQRATGVWSFHPLDATWWSPTQTITNNTPAREVVDDARVLGDQVGQALWGAGGLIERVDKWWNTQSGTSTKGAPAEPTERLQPRGPANRCQRAEDLRTVRWKRR